MQLGGVYKNVPLSFGIQSHMEHKWCENMHLNNIVVRQTTMSTVPLGVPMVKKGDAKGKSKTKKPKQNNHWPKRTGVVYGWPLGTPAGFSLLSTKTLSTFTCLP